MPVNVVTPRKPWGLIAAAVTIVAFAAAVLAYAALEANKADAHEVTSADQIPGVTAYNYSAGQEHTNSPVVYEQTPPVGGPHNFLWADCTGTTYADEIDNENAVHSLEHGAVWITYDPKRLSDEGVKHLHDLVDGKHGLMLSPYAGLDSVISIQSWNHQMFADSATDARISQYVDFLLFNSEHTPEIGASCESPAFLANNPVA